MADKKKTSQDQETRLDQIEDAEIVSPQDKDDPVEPVTEDAPPEDVQDAVAQSDAETRSDPEAEAAPETGTTDIPDPSHDAPVPEPETPQPTTAAPVKTEIVRKGGFVPMVLGGVVAAGIGFGLAQSGVLNGIPLSDRVDVQPLVADISTRLEAQQSSLDALGTRLAAIESAVDAPAPDTADITPLLEDLSVQIGVLAQRIDAIESRPAPSATAVDPDMQAAIDAAKSELDQIRQALADQGGQLSAITEAAAREEEAAQLSARAVLLRAAVARVQTALDAGTPFAEAVTDLQDGGANVPEALTAAAAEGVVTLPALQASFPDLARDALRAARQQAGTPGLGGFLETQLGLRSLTPREGDDPDAILSRAEAFLRDGALDNAVAEIAQLPEPALAVLADWSAQAQTRIAALSAAQALAQAVNSN